MSTVGWEIDKVSEKLRGNPGSQVAVTYARPGVTEPIKLKFTRAVVHVPAVAYTGLFDQQVGYIPLQTFNENAAEEVSAAVEKLEQQGAKGIVLDMRDNGGGIVDQALAVSGLFLREGQEIVSVHARNTPMEIARARGPHIGSNIPLVVLVDGSSASATEIVAGALQDHDRALIVGTTSFGKGLVQSVFPLDGGYFLKMTTGKWFTPSGRSIHRERQLLPDGRFVEMHPDSLETDSARKTRPTFQSDAGRTVYGGGGIAPDVIVTDDTLSTVEQQFLRSIAPRGQIVQGTLEGYAFELKGTVKRDFVLSPSWTSEITRRLVQRRASLRTRAGTSRGADGLRRRCGEGAGAAHRSSAVAGDGSAREGGHTARAVHRRTRGPRRATLTRRRPRPRFRNLYARVAALAVDAQRGRASVRLPDRASSPAADVNASCTRRVERRPGE